jgi:hypothetical protein
MHYGNNYFNTYSIKLKRNVSLFSELEYHNYLTLELDSFVVSFCEQPLKIEINLDGKLMTSIFDMWVLYKDGTEEFQEVKYVKEIEKVEHPPSRTMCQIQKQRMWCEQHDYKYSIRTEKEIYKGPYYISNLKYLRGLIARYNGEVNKEYLIKIKNHLQHGRVNILTLTQLSNSSGAYIFSVIAYGLYTGVIETNLTTKLLSYDTYVWLK